VAPGESRMGWVADPYIHRTLFRFQLLNELGKLECHRDGKNRDDDGVDDERGKPAATREIRLDTVLTNSWMTLFHARAATNPNPLVASVSIC